MDQIPIRALNHDTAGVLARVQAGEVIEITRRGRPVARIVPVGADELAELVASGVVRPPTEHGRMIMPTVPMSSGPSAGPLLESMRDEERW